MVSDSVGGYHGRAELGLLRRGGPGGVSVCSVRKGPREGGKGWREGWVRGDREIENEGEVVGEWGGEERKNSRR